MHRILPALMAVVMLSISHQLHSKTHKLKSPDGELTITISVGQQLSYSIEKSGTTILVPSAISMILDNGNILGDNAKVISAKTSTTTESISSPMYRCSQFTISYNQFELKFKGGYGVQFRAYNEGGAYRFCTTVGDSIIVKNEHAEFNFDKDYTTYIPYSTNKKNPYNMAFQNIYTKTPISRFDTANLAFTPLVVDLQDGIKATIMESDLESYPGMFIKRSTQNETGLQSDFAPAPAEFHIHPKRCQEIVSKTQPYIAKTTGTRTFPWRIVAVSSCDTQMPTNDLVYALASKSRVNDISWIVPGKVAWEWWNHWGITGVDFEAGINNATYKYYIDFASKNNIEYIVLDEGWSSPVAGDVMSAVKDINLDELIAYATARKVGLLLWVVADVLDNKLEEACAFYSKKGIKGFKVDFIDRDDQAAVEQIYRLARVSIKHKLILDMHGIYKPTGLNRTFPNLINFESVFGMEELKWSNEDMPLYDVTMPFIRMAAGPVDYTPGAMKNATKANFSQTYNAPMSQGTRAHQLATYIVFDSPLVTLCDSPSLYNKEQECVDFISSLPTTFDYTKVLQGAIGEYIVTMRTKDDKWYVGGLTSWTPRKILLDFSFLPQGDYSAEIIRDGINAHRNGEDYHKEIINIKAQSSLSISMKPGGGFAIKITKK